MRNIVFILSLFMTKLIAYDISLYAHPDHLSNEFMRHLISNFNVDTLVETGTYTGMTAECASHCFSEVYTVEIHKNIFLETKRRLARFQNISMYCDNSFNFLIYPEISKLERPLYWLDAHYCGEGTGTLYSEKKWIVSPLEHELEIILNNWPQKGVVLIDDLRGYLNLRSEDKLGREYTTVSKLYSMVKAHGEQLVFYVLGDMGIIYDSTYFPVSVSPYVKSCTKSYIFNPFEEHDDRSIEELLLAESLIANAPFCPELDNMIDLLYKNPLHAQDWSGYYPVLWHGLRNLGAGKYALALRDFEQLISIDPNIHERIYLYVIICYNKLGDINGMQKYIKLLSERIKKCAIKTLAWDDIFILDSK
ncbi:MAG: hypothetical protein K9M07_04915 [Simkaniaceae bacterium]|nr:hypothetical protein [Simkaniaceae bacterium]